MTEHLIVPFLGHFNGVIKNRSSIFSNIFLEENK